MNEPGNATRNEQCETQTIGDGNHNSGNRFWLNLPKPSGEQAVIIVLFVLVILTLSVNGWMYARGMRNEERLLQAQDRATKAETDLKTQVWLRSDALTKENADIRGHVIAIENLVQAYHIANLPRPSPLKEEQRK